MRNLRVLLNYLLCKMNCSFLALFKDSFFNVDLWYELSIGGQSKYKSSVISFPLRKKGLFVGWQLSSWPINMSTTFLQTSSLFHRCLEKHFSEKYTYPTTAGQISQKTIFRLHLKETICNSILDDVSPHFLNSCPTLEKPIQGSKTK